MGFELNLIQIYFIAWKLSHIPEFFNFFKRFKFLKDLEGDKIEKSILVFYEINFRNLTVRSTPRK